MAPAGHPRRLLEMAASLAGGTGNLALLFALLLAAAFSVRRVNAADIWRYGIVVSSILAPVLIGLVISILLHPLLHARYLICTLPSICVLAACGIANIRDRRLLAAAAIGSVAFLAPDPSKLGYPEWRTDIGPELERAQTISKGTDPIYYIGWDILLLRYYDQAMADRVVFMRRTDFLKQTELPEKIWILIFARQDKRLEESVRTFLSQRGYAETRPAPESPIVLSQYSRLKP